jgi:tricorn protease
LVGYAQDRDDSGHRATIPVNGGSADATPATSHCTMAPRERYDVASRTLRAKPLPLPPGDTMHRCLSFVLAVCAITLPPIAEAAPPLLLQTPSVSADRIAFVWAGNLWVVPRSGGDARGLLRADAGASHPVFSPDGSRIAYSAKIAGNEDVYVIATAGGEPRRLTWHPGADVVAGWTPDGDSVLFASHREAANDSGRLYRVPLSGGLPQALPLPRAEGGSYSPDGTHIAYEPDFQWEPDWRGYRGGQTAKIWIARLSDSSVTKIPRDNSNDRNPMWLGDTVYFLSDRNGPATLFSYDTASGRVTQLIANDGFPIDAAAAGHGAIVYTRMGALHLYDLASHGDHRIDVRVAADLGQSTPRYQKVAKHIEHAAISPTGVRAVFEAHGEILTVPADKGDIRDITRTTGVAERDPAWSPDGRSIAYFSDASGEYTLDIAPQDGIGKVRSIALGQPPSFFHSPVFSPDGSHVAYSDKRLKLWVVASAGGTPVEIDHDRYDMPLHEFDTAWSPDGRWLAYTRQLPNHLRAVFVHSLASGRTTQVTDGMSDCLYPVFDANGKYLYFTASTDTGLSTGWLDMTSNAHPVTRHVYVAVLLKGEPSPLAPQSDEDKGVAASADGDDGKKERKNGEHPAGEATPVAIDFDGILQRTLALPIEAANIVGLQAGKSGELFLLEAPQVVDSEGDVSATLRKFDLSGRKVEKFADDVSDLAVSRDGAKLLYSRKDDWFIIKTDGPPKDAGAGQLDLGGMQVETVASDEWRQMYDEVWRIERDFFYDPNFHGLDLAAAKRRFEPWLAGVGNRDDLTWLFRKMLAWLSVGHMFVRGGDAPDLPKITIGLLGADFAVAHGRYRFARVFNGENWNPDLHAPLTQPGVNVAAGDYLLAVNGRELRPPQSPYAPFAETVGKQTVLRVGPNADGSHSREVTVVPIKSEQGLRHLAWVEGNRRKVDELSGGKLAYVHLPDTGGGGFTSFNRYFFAQTDKQGAVIDERYNHGGQLADYVIDYLRRPPMSRVVTREGETYTEPTQAIFGPKVMLINQFSGSGGDAMPWYFKRAGVGPLIGMRTWGGLVGIGDYPPLIDGGTVTAPRWAISGLEGRWEIENHGVAPDIEVWQDPKQVREGHDPQLERAVAYLMQQLAEHPQPRFATPPYPDFKPVLPPADAGP